MSVLRCRRMLKHVQLSPYRARSADTVSLSSTTSYSSLSPEPLSSRSSSYSSLSDASPSVSAMWVWPQCSRLPGGPRTIGVASALWELAQPASLNISLSQFAFHLSRLTGDTIHCASHLQKISLVSNPLYKSEYDILTSISPLYWKHSETRQPFEDKIGSWRVAKHDIFQRPLNISG